MRSIDGKTQIVTVIGDPIEHTLSPAMHNAAFEALDMNWAYIACHVLPENIGGAVEAIRALGLRGMNITVPHKQGVMAGLDTLSDAARAVGAVNTIVHSDGKLHGDNTDVVGIIRAITEGAGVSAPPEHAVVLGAGGAARGIVYALTTLDGIKRVTVLNRTVAKAESLANEFTGPTEVIGASLAADEARSAMTGDVLVINATSVGRGSLADSSPVDDRWGCLHESVVCIDSNYSPPRTRLMAQVEAAGGRAYNGLDMLVYQGARSFELWTGEVAPVDVMRRAVLGTG